MYLKRHTLEFIYNVYCREEVTACIIPLGKHKDTLSSPT